MKQNRKSGRVARALIRFGLFVGSVIGVVLTLALPAAIFYAAAKGHGLLADFGNSWGYLAGGAGLALATAAVVSIMGESLIEDVVKFVLFAIPVFALHSMLDPHLWIIALGAPCGALVPLMGRLVWGVVNAVRGPARDRRGSRA